jgi:hypothetical protein
MFDDELDLMPREDRIVPSSGFVSNVMDALQQEESTPPPIPFPWKWALPLLAEGALVLTLFIFVAQSPAQSKPAPFLADLIDLSERLGVQWIVLALTITFASLRFSRIGN